MPYSKKKGGVSMKQIRFVEARDENRTVYRCRCSLCNAMSEVEPKNLRYHNGYKLEWDCENCNLNTTRENIFLLQRKKIVYRSYLRFDVEK